MAKQTILNHLENDPDFAELYEQAIDEYRDKVVDHHTDLLFDGEITKKFDKDGHCIEEKHSYPIRLIELELKRVDASYRDKQTIDLNNVGAGVLVAPPELTPEQWIKQQEAANENKKPPEVDKLPGKKEDVN